MSREVLLSLKTTHYERALKLVQRIRQGARDALQQTQEADDTQQRQGRLRARAKRLRGRDVASGQQGRFGAAVGSIGSAHERVDSVLSAIESRSVGSIAASVGQFLPGIGPILAVAGPLMDRLMTYVDERIEIKVAVLEAKTLARLEEERLRDDYTRRLREDPSFQAEQAHEGFYRLIREEAALGKRVHRVDLLGEL